MMFGIRAPWAEHI